MNKQLIDQAIEALETERLFSLGYKTKNNMPMQRTTETTLAALRAERDRVEQVNEMLTCDIEPRPLTHKLHDYHTAMSEGPLHYTWIDKPHRLVYDLIAAVKFYAHPPAQPASASMADNCRINPHYAGPSQCSKGTAGCTECHKT